MSLSPEAINALYASEAGLSVQQQLANAYERNLQQGIIINPESKTDAEAVAIRLAENIAAETLNGSLTENEKNFLDVSYLAREKSERLFDRIYYKTPELEAFTEAGIDFTRLGIAYTIMNQLHLEPQLVIAPVLKVTEWISVFKHLEDDSGVNHDGRIKNGGLTVHNNVATNWATLQADQHSVLVSGRPWQVTVMPGTNYPSVVVVDYFGNKKDEGHFSENLQVFANRYVPYWQQQRENMLPTLATYLTLQAINLQDDKPPIDDDSSSWLVAGTSLEFDKINATVAYSYPHDGTIIINRNPIDSDSPTTGVRLPVWGN